MAIARAVKASPEVYIATTTGVVKVKGVLIRYIAGKTHIDTSRPEDRALLKAVPDSFAPMRFGPVIES